MTTVLVLERVACSVYSLIVSSLYLKKINGKAYWSLREMAWVEGKPKMWW